MNPNPRRDAALALLAKTGIWRSNYEPPILRVLWKLGFDVPPPHFASFGGTAIGLGLFFDAAWGVSMWLLVWLRSGLPVLAALISAAFAGVFFGLAMASYYAHGRRRHKLPPWASLGAPPPDA